MKEQPIVPHLKKIYSLNKTGKPKSPNQVLFSFIKKELSELGNIYPLQNEIFAYYLIEDSLIKLIFVTGDWDIYADLALAEIKHRVFFNVPITDLTIDWSVVSYSEICSQPDFTKWAKESFFQPKHGEQSRTLPASC